MVEKTGIRNEVAISDSRDPAEDVYIHQTPLWQTNGDHVVVSFCCNPSSPKGDT